MALATQRDSAFIPSPHQSAPQPNHDVFLSFRGEDTGLSFVSHLYHELQLRGIKTFKDDPKLESGTAVSSGLFNAIKESRLAIVVLSPNYVSSSWCLDELTEILQCMKSKGTILPVFYHVKPSDVRKQSGSFADAFAELEERFREDIERVKSWRAALTEVANLSGLDSKNESERKLIEYIVEWAGETVGMKATSEKWIFLLISLCLEILSIACDQASSPRNPHYALFGMMLAIAAVLICILELIYKGKKERVELRRWRTLWWFYYPGPQQRLYGSLPDIYGLVGAISQCICSTVQYVCFIRHNQNPIKVSLWPAIFLICLGASRLNYINGRDQ